MPRNFTFLADCETPAEVIMVADSSPDSNGAYSGSLWYKKRKHTVGVNNEGVKAAHGQNSNILFVDGHARAYNATEINFNDAKYKDWWNPNPALYPISF